MEDNMGQGELVAKLRAAEKRIAELEQALQTAKKEIEATSTEATAQAEALRLSLALEAAQAGIWEWDLRTNKNIWSNELWAVYGLEPHSCEPSYEAWRKVIYPEDREPAELAVQLAAQNGTELKVEWRVVAGDGSIRWVMSRGKPVRDASGQIERFLGIVLDITERKQVEEAFRTSEARYRSLFENMLNGFAYCRMLYDQGEPQDFIYLDVNRAFETLTGLKDVTGKKVSDVIPGIREADPELFKIYGRVALTGTPETFEMYVETMQMWFWVSVYSPQPEYFVATFDVITERKQVEQALRQSEENFSKAFKSSPAALLVTRLSDGLYLEVNDAYCTIVGYDRAELIGHRTTDFDIFINPTDRQDIIAQLLVTGSMRDFETSIRNRSGAIRHVVAGQELISFNGETCILSTFLDITNRKQVEQALWDSEQRLKVAIKASNMILAQTDLEARYTWIHNPHPDFDPREVLGKTDIELADNEGTRVLFDGKRQVIATGVGLKTEIAFPVSDGLRSYDVFVDPLYDAAGRWLGVSTSAYDITELKRVETELRRSNAELEQFAYVASHDLQEPLRAVAGMVQLLSQRYKGQLDDRADEYITHAVEASGRMQNLINDLLDYSRVDRFGRPFEPTAVEKSLQTVLANLQMAIQDSQAQISHDSLPTVMADPSQLGRVLQNLIGNALKFRGEAAPHIHVGATKEAQAWRFSVSDNGIGIEPQYFERIFLVFQRLHTRREYPGTGIGLSLCKKIIERHGGRIWVESQPGQGATFYFTIPKRNP
ncbi:MAG TPA: PAS domain S-box protein [Anaerolineae bacterium]|nr:PAS domain S-box protein [Anaerolineae bacterium]